MKLQRRKINFLSSWIGVVLLLEGILLFIFSIYATQQILAFIGLGLTLWGVLFLLVTPTRYVEGTLLPSTAITSYLTIDRIIKDLKHLDKGYYIPPFSANAILPENLKGLAGFTVFVSAEDNVNLPSIEEIAKGSFTTKNPKGVLLAPPGIGLFTRIEEKSGREFSQIPIEKLCEILPKVIVENLNLAKEIELVNEENQIRLTMSDSQYRYLFDSKNNFKSLKLLGCPTASAIACALAKATSKTVTIQNIITSNENSKIEVSYRIIQG